MSDPSLSWSNDKNWIQTNSGGQFYPLDPRLEDINILDIVEGISKECRYNGQTNGFYSVAEHCVILSRLVPERLAKAALLHDASEGYISDICRPVKTKPEMAEYVLAEARLQNTLYHYFRITHTAEDWKLLETLDSEMIHIEAPQVFKTLNPAWKLRPPKFDVKIQMLEWRDAKAAYMQRFNELLT